VPNRVVDACKQWILGRRWQKVGVYSEKCASSMGPQYLMLVNHVRRSIRCWRWGEIVRMLKSVEKYLSIACQHHGNPKKTHALSCIHGLKTVFFLGLATLYCTLSHFFTGFKSEHRLYRLLYSREGQSSCTLLD